MCTRIVSDIHFAKMQIRRYWLWLWNIQFLQGDRRALFPLLNIRSLRSIRPFHARPAQTVCLIRTDFLLLSFPLIQDRREPLSRTLNFHDCVFYLFVYFFVRVYVRKTYPLSVDTTLNFHNLRASVRFIRWE